MTQGIDHVVIGVRDLARASADFAALGFTVTPGGEHAGGATRNALIGFADGTYLELIAFTESDRPQNHRWWNKIAAGEGLIDFALRSADVAADAARLEGAGIADAAVQEGGRLRPDGQRVGWRNLVVDHPAAPWPFLIEDVTPRELRVPGGVAAEHPLGVSGVAGISVVVADRNAAAGHFAAFLGTPGEPTSSLAGLGAAQRFAVGPQWLELVQPGDEVGEAARYLAERGEGVFALTLRGAGAQTASALSRGLAHGARISVAPGG